MIHPASPLTQICGNEAVPPYTCSDVDGGLVPGNGSRGYVYIKEKHALKALMLAFACDQAQPLSIWSCMDEQGIEAAFQPSCSRF